MSHGTRRNIYLLHKHNEMLNQIARQLDNEGIRGIIDEEGNAKPSVVIQVLIEQRAKELGNDIDQRSLWKKKAAKE